jgi:hypothetical protein
MHAAHRQPPMRHTALSPAGERLRLVLLQPREWDDLQRMVTSIAQAQQVCVCM